MWRRLVLRDVPHIQLRIELIGIVEQLHTCFELIHSADHLPLVNRCELMRQHVDAEALRGDLLDESCLDANTKIMETRGCAQWDLLDHQGLPMSDGYCARVIRE